MTFLEFQIGPDDIGRRFDKVLRKFLWDENLSGIYKAIRKGLIKINDRKSSADYKLQENDRIKIPDFMAAEKYRFHGINAETESDEKKSIGFETVFRNEFLWIINKPFDRCVQGTENSLDKEIQIEFKQSNRNTSLSFLPGPLHRLDRRTTGLLAFSQNLEGAKWFSQNIEKHRITKTYVAIAQGHLSEKESWTDYIRENETTATQFKTVSVYKTVQPQSKKAVTHAIPIKYGTFNGKELTLIKYEIETGRHHQIRSQSSFHGFPLLGDEAYGGSPLEDGMLFLHAQKLDFPENPLKLPKEIQAPLPPFFSLFLEKHFEK